MLRATMWSKALLPLAGFLGAAWLSGCAFDASNESDEHVGAAEQRQIDSGTSHWRKLIFYQNNDSGPEFGELIAVNRSSGGFVAGNEYWYVDKSALGNLGTSNVYISYSDGIGTPSAPSYSNMQSFTMVTNPTGGWGSGWTSDPLASLGKLYQNGSHSLRLQTTGSGSSTTVTAVAWYQVIPSGNSPANIAPSGTFGYASGGSVTVGTGNLGYAINQTP
jgi:hypothetical protein